MPSVIVAHYLMQRLFRYSRGSDSGNSPDGTKGIFLYWEGLVEIPATSLE